MLNVLTIALFMVAIIVGVVGFKLSKGFGLLLRPSFVVLTFLSAWSVLVTVFWLAGVELKVGTIQDGKMAVNWWLPIATTGYAAAIYFVGRRHNKHKEVVAGRSSPKS